MPWNTDVFDDIRNALADMPRSGRPTKIPRELLAKAEAWCLDRAFTPTELCNYMEEISGVRLSLSQTRRYAVQWRYSRKKTSPMHVNKAAIQDVESWQESITRMVAQYTKLGYAIATQDESNYTRCHTICTILGKGRIAHIHAVVRGPSEVFHVLYHDIRR